MTDPRDDLEDQKLMEISIIFDNDAGGDIDDLFTLALILAHPDLRLLGVTTVVGNTQARARLVAKMLRLANRPKVPVYAGLGVPEALRAQGKSFERKLSHTAFVTEDDPEHDIIYEDGVTFILDTLRTTRKPITLIGTGACTNISEVLRQADEHQRSMIACIALMGGEVHLLHTEANINTDPEAAAFVLHSGIPIFLGTWSVSRALQFSMAEVEALCDGSEDPFIAGLLTCTRLWWGAGKAEKIGPVCYDACPVFWAAGERRGMDCIELAPFPIELHGIHTRGAMVLHPWKRFAARPATTTRAGMITAADSLDAAWYKQRYCQLVFGREP